MISIVSVLVACSEGGLRGVFAGFRAFWWRSSSTESAAIVVIIVFVIDFVVTCGGVGRAGRVLSEHFGRLSELRLPHPAPRAG